MVNEENKGVKIVGVVRWNIMLALKQIFGCGKELEPKQLPPLSNLLEKEKLLFSKEIEVMYDLEQLEIESFVEKELSANTYQKKEILGESYFTTIKE